MKYIREISDIHLDFDVAKKHDLWTPHKMDGDLDTCLIIAGDLWTDRKFLRDTWLKDVASQFKYVVFVLGNHDYWGTNITYEAHKVKEAIIEQNITNAFLLEQDVLVLDQVKFIGGTLWTNMKNGDPLIVMDAHRIMQADFSRIKEGASYKKLSAQTQLQIYTRTVQVIEENAFQDNFDQKVIIVTHMAPSYKSVHEKYRTASGYLSNFFYFSDLERIIDNHPEIDFWFHGHVHNVFDYHPIEDRKCRVICNPRGYFGHEDTGVDELFRIEL